MPSMPQIEPYYFTGQAVMVVIAMVTLVYSLSVYLLPPLLQLCITRLYVSKLLASTVPCTSPHVT